MTKKKITYSVSALLGFIVGCTFIIFVAICHQTAIGRKQQKVYDKLNSIFRMKLRGDLSYKKLCGDEAVQGIETYWPSEANSYQVIIDGNLFGSYDGKIFFDTGNVFTFVTSKSDDNILESFVELKWPDRISGANYWNVLETR